MREGALFLPAKLVARLKHLVDSFAAGTGFLQDDPLESLFGFDLIPEKPGTPVSKMAFATRELFNDKPFLEPQ